MEDNKDYKKTQKFYFTESGQLVVESNKGVWVDGEPFVKMYGSFVCNAKTMGMIIQAMKGMTVEVGTEEVVKYTKEEVVDKILDIHQHTIEHYCILGVDQSRIGEYLEELARNEYTNTKIREAEENRVWWRNKFHELDMQLNNIKDVRLIVKKHNALPWYKRFKKIKY